MNIAQIEENVKQLLSDVAAGVIPNNDFIFEFMLAYGHRKSSVSRVKSGERNLAKVEGEVRWKRHVYFKQTNEQKLHYIIDDLRKDKAIQRDRIRFVIVTNFNEFLAIDTKTGESLDVPFENLAKHFDFFLPWSGMEKAVYQGENPADVKAAEKMAKLFDLIRADNFDDSNKDDPAALHGLNVFLTRILFCFFAEDTGIFSSNQFSLSVESHTKDDGTDLNSYLDRLFTVLNSAENARADLPDYLRKFPYVNGGLFAEDVASPRFSTKSRRMLIECGNELDWSDINPDIFGSMIQAVVHPEQRGNMGMHYTSVTNIMKVIEPLFLNELYEELDNIDDNIDPKLKPSRLRKLKERLTEIKVFDPACGSGNFLIIAYKELRKFEMEVIKRLQEIDEDKNQNQDDLFAEAGLDSSYSELKLSQFYGIELDDFAHEVAILSLWLAEHQMNLEFKAEFGDCKPSLPLQSGGQIVCGNATELDWENVCGVSKNIFILGNPPYLGNRYQQTKHKSEIRDVCKGIPSPGNLDYISCWFVKAAEFIRENVDTKAAFVSTNSICQGTQVELLWPYIFSQTVEIIFAHQTFKWTNNAKNVAGVHCIIVGIGAESKKKKKLYADSFVQVVDNINGYLTNGKNVFVKKMKTPLTARPKMDSGSKATDDGNLILSLEEKNSLLEEFPECHVWIKKIFGAQEFIKGSERWCLWIPDSDLNLALEVPPIKERVDKCKEYRLQSSKVATQKKAQVSHQFDEVKHKDQHSIIVPTVTSERRNYLPIGFLTKDQITIAPNNAIYGGGLDIFGLISSKMHMAWIRAVAGRLKSDYRYSSALCYNSFPIPKISDEQSKLLESKSLRILEIREKYPEYSMSFLYDPDKMPEDLKVAHSELDLFVDRLYSQNEFKTDEERLQNLFSLYEKMTGGQNA